MGTVNSLNGTLTHSPSWLSPYGSYRLGANDAQLDIFVDTLTNAAGDMIEEEADPLEAQEAPYVDWKHLRTSQGGKGEHNFESSEHTTQAMCLGQDIGVSSFSMSLVSKFSIKVVLRVEILHISNTTKA
jgi:hypothetical protein